MSFKLKLVAYFLLVSLLPLGAAAWGLHAVARRSETRGVDVRLEAGLRAVLASYKDELRAAGDKAAALASNDPLVVVEGQTVAAGPARLQGARFVPPLRAHTLEVAGDRYRVLATQPQRGRTSASLALLSPQDRIDDAVARADRRLLLGVLGSLILIVLVAYVVGGSIVVTLGRLAGAANAIARGRLDRRVQVQGRDEFARLGLAFNEMADQLEARAAELDAERARLRDATVRFGEALAATHDVDQLLRVIVGTVVEATGATGGIVAGLGGEVVQTGTLSDRGERFDLPLTAGRQSFGTLTISAAA